ncbi:MAG TPA: YicC family protein [Ruminococcaceae bacterium]|nr:YicC family protein [Oscillospiraceae bacterium]
MIRSMTGFGRDHRIIDGREYLVEIRSVNSRYYEFNAKLPRQYMFLEEKLKSLVKAGISRGKVEVSLSIYNIGTSETSVTVNEGVVENYLNVLRAAGEKFGLTDDLTVSTIFRMTDAFSVVRAEADEDKIWAAVKETAEAALAKFIAMRETEGAKMKDDILEKLSNIEKMTERVCEYAPETVTAYRERLFAKMQEILENKQIDEQRILLEAGIYAEKIAVDEETVRLKSHFVQFRDMMNSDEPIGRKLDFLVQEINREVNTTGSKAQDLRVTRLVVDMKSEIEKIREQIQNIE